MTELERLLADTYGQGYQPDLGQDSLGYLLRGPAPPVTTADINAAYPRFDDAGTRGLRLAQHATPQNPDHGLSAFNMARAGLGSAANWLDQRPEIGPDTLAPLGLAGIGMAPAGALAANAIRRSPDLPAVWRGAHPRTSVEGRTAGEGIANSAIRTPEGEQFVAPTHYEALQAAEARRGPTFIDGVDDGFVTTTGRYLDRNEAMMLARAVNDPAKRSFRDFMDSTDLPHVGPWSPYAIRADSSRGSLPGTLVNAVEQSSKPTAGTTPLSPRQQALERGQVEFQATGPTRQESGLTPLGGAHDGDGYFADIALRQSRGDYDKALALLADNPRAANVLRYWRAENYSLRPYADPARTQSYWQAANDFRLAQPPPRDRMNATTGLPLPAQEPDDLASMLARQYPAYP